MAINTQKKSEGIHYELVPHEDDDQAWHVRILEGEHPETVLQYGAIAFNKVKDCMTFNFTVVSSPDQDLTSDDESLQLEAGEILEDIIANGIKDGSVQMRDRNE